MMLFVSFEKDDNIAWTTDILNLLKKRHLNFRVFRSDCMELHATVTLSEDLNGTVHLNRQLSSKST